MKKLYFTIALLLPVVYYIFLRILVSQTSADSIRGIANDSFYYVVGMGLLTILFWLVKENLLNKKVIFFFVGLMLILLNTIMLALVNEFTVGNGLYLFVGMFFSLSIIIPIYLVLYILICYIKNKKLKNTTSIE